MFRVLAVTALVFTASAAPALAQHDASAAPAPALTHDSRPSQRYEACRAAQGADSRIEGVCEVIDEIHSRLEDARGQTRRRAELRMALSSALFVIGAEGDLQASRDCIDAARGAQVFYNAERFPTYWSMLQHSIGVSLIRLGNAGDEAARNEAPVVLSAGAATVDRASQPELWATLQEDLGRAYYSQAQGEDREVLLQAVSAFRAAMEIYRRPVFADRRAHVERQLAELYRILGQERDPA